MVLFSVVIPTYKRTELLDRAIKSVLNQNFFDYEIIVIDDNEIDSPFRMYSKELEKEYSGNNAIKFNYNEKNCGGAESRNIGIRLASGQYVAFLDDDDIFLSNKLQVFSNIIEKNSDFQMFYGRQKNSFGVITDTNISGNLLYELLVLDCIAATTQWVISKEALMSVNGFDKVPAKQESILQYKLFKKGYNALFIDEVLTYVEDTDRERISSRTGKSLEGEINFRNIYIKDEQLFSKEQNRKIKLAFSSRLLKEFYKRKMFSNFFSELLEMFKISPSKTIQFFQFIVLKKMRGDNSESWIL